MAQLAANVSAASPISTGGVLVAPKGTALPTDETTALNAAFKALGYIGERRVLGRLTNTEDTTKKKDRGNYYWELEDADADDVAVAREYLEALNNPLAKISKDEKPAKKGGKAEPAKAEKGKKSKPAPEPAKKKSKKK